MKKTILAALLMLLMLLCLPACADTARDVAAACTITFEDNSLDCAYLTDHNLERGNNLPSRREHVFYVTTGDTPVAQLEVYFGTHALPMRVQKQQDGQWITVAQVDEARGQSYACFEPLQGTFRIVFYASERSQLTLREILLYSAGDTQGTALHAWQDVCQKADILALVAHPDDELLWFGGLLPTYAGERGMQVQVAYMTCENAVRRQELLNGLWHCGVRNYPIIYDLKDVRYKAVEDAYRVWGLDNTYQAMVRAIRRCKPDVLVTHDILGEYGHTQHIVTSEAAYQAVLLAADASYDPQSAAQYGIWQVKKLYRHLGDAPTTRMDWTQPLSAFGGQTGLEIASQAFKMHVTQQDILWPNPPAAGEQYDSTLYTLVYSTVGEDTAGNDLMENVQ